MTGKRELLQYQGRSMWPCFQEGDLLEVIPTDISAIRNGDCVAYRSGEKIVVHRVVCAKETLTTRGDAHSEVDKELVPPEQLLGKVVCLFRLGRSIPVREGALGQIFGLFYRYAGRIDPQRDACGGQLARGIRYFSSICLRLCHATGSSKTFVGKNQSEMILWFFGKTSVGRQDQSNQRWVLSWPWSVFLKPPEQH